MKKYSKKLKNLINDIPTNKRLSPDNNFKYIIFEETKFLKLNTPMRSRMYYVINDIHDVIMCPICKTSPTNVKYNNIDKTYSIRSCSKHCDMILRSHEDENGKSGYSKSREKQHQTMSQLDEHGHSRYSKSREKQHQTMSQLDENGKSGYDIIANKFHIIMSQVDKNGKSGYSKSREKQHQTMSQLDENGKSGYFYAHKDRILLKKIKTYNERLNNFPQNYKLLTTKDEYIIDNNILKYQHSCDTIMESYWPYIRCTKCYPYNKSIGENEVLEFCKSLTNNIISNSRQIISPLELDIYLPEYNLAIEYNGLYYHSSYSIESESKNYHLYKTQECEKQGIQLFHIFENEWQDPQKQKIWKSIISNRLGKSERIFARKTGVRSVSSTEKSQFLISNHLQGDCVSSVNLGLFLDDELVSLMTFGRSRYDKKIDWELIRFCNKIGYSVVGGASRLLKAFRKENLGSITSYADKRRSSGNLYKQIRFELSHESGPNYFYYKDQGLESRLKYQKHKLKDKLEVFDPSLAESENMYRNGYRKIYDCGNQVWILK